MLPKGLGNLGNLGGMMKQAMQMKAKMEEMKERLGAEIIEASVGGGMVSVTMNGRFEVIKVYIDPEIVDKNDPDTLTTMVQAGFNEAVRKVQELIQEKMREVAGGLDIPGLL